MLMLNMFEINILYTSYLGNGTFCDHRVYPWMEILAPFEFMLLLLSKLTYQWLVQNVFQGSEIYQHKNGLLHK